MDYCTIILLYNSHNQGLGKKMEYVNKKIPSVTVITTALNAKAIDVKNKVPDIINISTKGSLTTKATQIEKKKYLILVILLILKNKTDVSMQQ